MPQVIGVPKEIFPGEKRVATVPEVVEKLHQARLLGHRQAGAGEAASIGDDAYTAAGAKIVPDAAALWSSADIVFKVRAPTADEVALMSEGQTLVSFIWPAQNPELMQAARGAQECTVLAMDSVPRISRAQKMRCAVLDGEHRRLSRGDRGGAEFGRFFTGQITAAGKVPPAKVFVIGAGVAGLAAIGAASGLGAIVRANDTRPEVADQVKSLGGEFVAGRLRGRGQRASAATPR